MSNRWRPFKLKFSAILLPTFWTNRIPRNIYVSLPGSRPRAGWLPALTKSYRNLPFLPVASLNPVKKTTVIWSSSGMTNYYKKYEPQHDKTNKMSVRPAKTQISLGIRPVWSESSLCAQWVAKDPSFLHAASEDFDQTGRMPRLIWVFAGRTAILLVLSCRGSILTCQDIVCVFIGSPASQFHAEESINFVSSQHRKIIRSVNELIIWTATWQNQQNECAPTEDSDQPGHPPVWSEFSFPYEESLGP